MMKRLFDFVVSLLVIFIALPLWLAVAIAIKLDSPGPVFYRGTRIGKDGKPFNIYKFRTTIQGADGSGPGITHRDDRRITRVGAILRRLKIDELPQLYNVAVGEMSLVGPRPEDPSYVVLYNEEQKEILREKPGVTSAASLAYRDEESLLSGPDWERTYREKVLPDKLRIDLEYMKQRTLGFDLKIILKPLVLVSGL